MSYLGRKLPTPAKRLRPSLAHSTVQAEKAANDFVLQVTPVYTQLENAYESKKYTVAVLEGGSRSSKTHSIIQFLIKYAQNNNGKEKRVLIARQKSTWTKATVLHDFLNILKSYGLYRKKDYNKSTSIYTLHTTQFWFGGLDDDQKLHGFQSNIFWINEAVEATKDDFDQLEQRLLEFCILDYNPSAEEHWIYENVCNRPDAIYIHSTMLQNPFIAEKSRLKILSYEPTPENYKNGTADKNKWDIYGLGLRSKIEGVIYTNWQVIDEIPEYIRKSRHRFGLDWGYSNDPTAIVDVFWNGKELWVDELCYKTEMLYGDIIKHIKKIISLEGVKGYGDSSDPRGIDEVHRGGVNIHEAAKPPGSVVAGITILKEFKIYVTSRSTNLIKELKNYKWMVDKNGKTLNEPIDDFNHALDALRYVAFMEFRQVKSNNSKKKKVKNSIP